MLPTGQAVRDNKLSAKLWTYNVPQKRDTTPTEYKSEFIGRIRRARTALHPKMTQAEMAARLGIDQARYKQYETRSILPIHFIPEFCRITGHHPWYILTGQDGSRSPGVAHAPRRLSAIPDKKRTAK